MQTKTSSIPALGLIGLGALLVFGTTCPATAAGGPVSVQVTNTVPVQVTNTPSVSVTGTPTVSVTGTASVQVTNTPSVQISGTPSVQISGTPSVQVSGTPSVQVTGTASTADVNNPDLQPVQFSTTLEQIGPGADTVNFPVPAHKRLCIDYVTIFPTISGAPQTITFTTTVGGVVVPFSVIGQYTGSQGISEPVKIYADQSTTLAISLATAGSTGVDTLSFTGHYINQ